MGFSAAWVLHNKTSMRSISHLIGVETVERCGDFPATAGGQLPLYIYTQV